MDAQLFHRLYGWFHVAAWLPVAMERITHLGDARVVLILTGLGLLESLVSWARFSRKAKEEEGPAVVPWLGVPVAAQVTGWLKEKIARPRPAEVFANLGAVPSPPGHAFPSGHATAIFALATALSIRWPNGKVLWFGLAGLVALSRIAIGVHWPSDVVVGALIGSGAVVSLACIERMIMQIKERLRR